MLTIFSGLLLAAHIALGSPVNYEISLAGNFGEPRLNHFHGGIDIKTGGVEGKPIFSMGDGYVSHVSVGVGGYGNALYIHHPEGYTSVYCHLKKFTPQIAAMVRKWQYAHRSFSGMMKFRPTDLPIAKGQLIAVSGNSGASQAPHLHLEIHDSKTWNMYDPLDFLGHLVKDGLPPMAHGFMAYPVQGEGSFCGGSVKQTYGFGSHQLTREFFAWGKVGFGIWANDYMEITYNRYGVRKTELFVDDRNVFSSDVNNIPVQGNMMVNAWGDYEHFLRYNVWYMRSYIQPGVTLPCLKADANRGIVNFNEERDYHLTYVLTDFKGNVSKYGFTVTGKRAPFAAQTRMPVSRNMLYVSRPNNFQLPGLQLTTPSGYVADDLELKPLVTRRPGAVSDAYRLMPASCPMFSYGKLSLRVKRPVKDPSKLYIVSRMGTNRYMGGVCHAGWVTGRARDLGATYELDYDDQAPLVNAVSLSQVLTVGMSDSGSGLAGYKAYLDGQFILFEEVPKSPWVRCDLEEAPVKKTGQMRQLKFVASDRCGNQRVFTTQIKY